MARTAKLVTASFILVAAAGAAAWWKFTQPPKDDYDYAAAFEANDPGSTAPLLKLADVAGKSPDALKALLGAPESCEDSLYSSRCQYAPGRTEVVFIDGKADWITVNDLGETPFKPAALSRIGLDERKPATKEDTQLIWTDVPGIKEIRVVGDGEHIEFIRIKVKS